MNLLQETKEILKEMGKKESDVLWVGSTDGKYIITFQQFKKLAQSFIYDEGFGAQEVARDLVVVGKDWWLERSEYDGSEGWEYKTIPSKTNKPKKIKEIGQTKKIMGESIEDLNEE